MIHSAFYNGINFSGDFARTSDLINFDLQRIKYILPQDQEIKWLSFFTDTTDTITSATLAAKSEGEDVVINSETPEDITSGQLIYFKIPANTLNHSQRTYFEVRISSDGNDDEVICSEFYVVQNFATRKKNSLKITAKNNDSRHGFLEDEAFGFFQSVGLNENFFINKKVEYEYSYGRKKILQSENNIGRRITFKDLSAYNQNLLKWLCNCELLYIDGVQYELISDFTELLADEFNEIRDLKADFVAVEQSFFGTGSASTPKNIFTSEFFIK